MTDATVTVTDNPDQHRYEVQVDGTLAGFAEYRLDLDSGVVDFTHTEVFEAFGGQGLAKKLAVGSLDDVRSRGLGARPYCPFYKKFIGSNREYADLVPVADRAKFDLA